MLKLRITSKEMLSNKEYVGETTLENILSRIMDEISKQEFPTKNWKHKIEIIKD